MTDTPANDNRAVHVLTFIEESDGQIVLMVFDTIGSLISSSRYRHHADAHEAVIDLVQLYPHATVDDRAGAMQMPSGSTPGGAA